MEELSKIISYKEYKQALDMELTRAAESFVRIGYLLKMARDTSVLEESGYTTVAQFAEAEYQLRPDQVSNFININDRFAEGGYSEQLGSRYAGMGYTKLVEMLQLPEAVNEELSPEFTRQDIRTIRQEIETEQKITDLEVMMEGTEKFQEDLPDNLGMVIRQIGHDSPELFVKWHRAAFSVYAEISIRELFAPSGENMYSVRIRGIGKFLLSVKSEEERIALINVRTGEKEGYSWENLAACLEKLIDTAKPEKEAWEARYAEPFPAEPEPERQEKPKNPEKPKKPEKKPSKVTKIEKKQEAKKERAIPVEAAPKEKPKEEPGAERGEEPGADLGENQEQEGQQAEIAPAQKIPENVIKSEWQQEEPKSDSADETSEPADDENEFFGTRKDYMDTLTEYGAGEYMAQAMQGFRQYSFQVIAEKSFWEAWFNEKVDEMGRKVYE